MATGDQYVNIQPKRLMGFQDFRERMIDYMRKVVKDIHDTAFVIDGVFGGTPITMAAHGANRFQLAIDAICSDGAGHFLKTNAELAGRDIGIQFENTNAVVYSIGLHYTQRPRGIQINPRTANPEFIAFEEAIGHLADPDLVTDNGDGTITFRVDSACDPFATGVISFAGRRCLVWKKTPGRTATTEQLAVESGLVVFASAHNKVTTTLPGAAGAGILGQTAGSVSVNAADYSVLLLGPTVTRKTSTNLELQAGYTFIGEITGNAGTPSAFSQVGQNALGSGFAVDLNAVTRVDTHGDLKLLVRADASDGALAPEKQIEVQNASGTTTWSVDETGTSIQSGDLTARGNANLGNAVSDQHTIRGTITTKDDTNVVMMLIDALGRMALGTNALGGAEIDTAKTLNVKGSTRFGSASTQIADFQSIIKLISNALAVKAVIDAETGKAVFGGSVLNASILRALGVSELTDQVIIGAVQNAGSASDGRRARIDFGSMNQSSGYNEIVKWTANEGGFSFVSWKARILGHGTGSNIVLTSNCSHNGTNWIKDSAGSRSMKFEMGGTGFKLSLRSDDADAPWDEYGWTTTLGFDSDGLRLNNAAPAAAHLYTDGGVYAEGQISNTAGDIIAGGGTVKGYNNVQALNGDVVAHTNFRYDAAKTRLFYSVPLTMIESTSDWELQADVDGSDFPTAIRIYKGSGAAGHFLMPITRHLPAGATITGAAVSGIGNPSGASYKWSIIKVLGGVITSLHSGGGYQNGAASIFGGVFSDSLSMSGQAVDPQAEYYLAFHAASGTILSVNYVSVTYDQTVLAE